MPNIDRQEAEEGFIALFSPRQWAVLSGCIRAELLRPRRKKRPEPAAVVEAVALRLFRRIRRALSDAEGEAYLSMLERLCAHRAEAEAFVASLLDGYPI